MIIVSVSLKKKKIWGLGRDCVEFIDQLGENCCLNIESSNP